MDGDAFVDFDALARFADEVKSSTGWLLMQCGIPCSTAVGAASASFPWPDAAPHFFGVRLDQEISALTSALNNFVIGLGDAAHAYRVTDQGLAGN